MENRRNRVQTVRCWFLVSGRIRISVGETSDDSRRNDGVDGLLKSKTTDAGARTGNSTCNHQWRRQKSETLPIRHHDAVQLPTGTHWSPCPPVAPQIQRVNGEQFVALRLGFLVFHLDYWSMGAHFQEPKEPPQEKSPPTTHHSDVMLRPIVFDVSRSIAKCGL